MASRWGGSDNGPPHPLLSTARRGSWRTFRTGERPGLGDWGRALSPPRRDAATTRAQFLQESPRARLRPADGAAGERFRAPRLGAAELAICLLSGVLGIALADTLYFRALNRLGASRAGVISNFYSPFVIVLSYLFLAERLAPLQIAGFFLVSIGVFLVSRPERSGNGHAELGAVLTGMLSIFLMAAAIVMVKRILEAQPLLWIVLLRLLGGILGMLLIFAFTGFPRALPVSTSVGLCSFPPPSSASTSR